MEPAEGVYAALDALSIRYERFEHPPVFTAADAAQHWTGIDGVQCKNLFLRNKKGNRHYLVIAPIERRVDLRQLVAILGDDRLSFGSPERLMAALGVTPGSVSPFALIHDEDRAVSVVIDEALRGHPRLIFHPNVNTASVVVSWDDLDRFLRSRGNVVRPVRL